MRPGHGPENLEAGNIAVIDDIYCDFTPEYVYGVAEAYAAWECGPGYSPGIYDLPALAYTKEFYPNYPRPSPPGRVPEGFRPGAQNHHSGSHSKH